MEQKSLSIHPSQPQQISLGWYAAVVVWLFLFHPSHLNAYGICLHPSRNYMPLNAWFPMTANKLPTACENVTCNISTSLQGAGLRWANHLTKATKPPLEHYDSLPEPAQNKWPGVLSHCSDGKLSETDNWAFWCFISPFIRFYHCRLFEYTVLFLNSFFAPSAHTAHRSLYLVADCVNYEALQQI